MDQIITLLSNLFNLSKVASVTLPGLALAGALALFLLPPHPVDTIRIPAFVKPANPLPEEQKPCSDQPALENGTSPKKPCKPIVAPIRRAGPACQLHPFRLDLLDDESSFDKAIKDDQLTAEDSKDIEIEPQKIKDIAKGYGEHKHPWDAKIPKQFVLETARDRLMQCDELERSRQGQEEADNAQLTVDIANLDKQRSDLQDAYIASLKSNDRIISKNFREKLSGILGLLDDYRERYNVNLVSVKERARRLEEIKLEQDNVSARLGEPGRLRPITGFDLYAQGLVNHVVGLILLSMALSLILIAFDRSVLGNLFESLFPGW